MTRKRFQKLLRSWLSDPHVRATYCDGYHISRKKYNELARLLTDFKLPPYCHQSYKEQLWAYFESFGTLVVTADAWREN